MAETPVSVRQKQEGLSKSMLVEMPGKVVEIIVKVKIDLSYLSIR